MCVQPTTHYISAVSINIELAPEVWQGEMGLAHP